LNYIENNVIDKAMYGIALVRDSIKAICKNNTITGRIPSNGDRAFHIELCGNTELHNNTISRFNRPLYLREANYYSPNNPFKIYGGSISNCVNDIWILYRSNTKLYNLSFDPTTIYFESSAHDPAIDVFYNVDVFVEDTTGPVGGAIINMTNGTKEINYENYTLSNGWSRLLVHNGTYKFNGPTYHAPYNISANVSGASGYPPDDYNGSGWQKKIITFNNDIIPSSPFNMDYSVDQSSVELYWDCYVNDLDSYKIFRTDTSNVWVELDNVTSPLPGVRQNWVDVGNSTNLEEYRYKIHHMDNASQEGANENSILFDDWVFTDKKSYQEQEIILNGSLIIENGGDLELRNITFTMNEDEAVAGNDGIEVRYGGKLLLTDSDNDPKTADDRTFINVSYGTQDDTYGFVVREGGVLEIRNSWIQNSSNYLSSIKRDCNIYNDQGKVMIYNSTIIITDYGIFFENVDDSIIYDTTFDNNGVNRYNEAIHIVDSKNILIEDNIFNQSLENEIFIFGSENINIINNYILSENITAIHANNTQNISIEYNTLKKSKDAIYLYKVSNASVESNKIYNFKDKCILVLASEDVLVNANEIFWSPFGHSGIFLYRSSDCEITNNTIDDIGSLQKGISCLRFKNLTLAHNEILNTYQGIYLSNDYSESEVGYVSINNNKVHHTDTDGYGIYLKGSGVYYIEHNEIFDSYYGFYIYENDGNYFDDNTIYNCTYGNYQYSGVDNLYHGSTMWNNDYGYFFLSGAEATIYNCTITGLPTHTVYVNASSDVTLINPYFNLTKINVSDDTSKVEVKWAFDLIVLDQLGKPQKDIFVRIRDVQETILMEQYTDPSGKLHGITLSTRTMFSDYNLTYTPHKFEAELGNHTGTLQVKIASSATIFIQLDNKAPSAYNIIVNPLQPQTKQDLVLDYIFLDPESDDESGTLIKWYKNDEYVPSLDNQIKVNWLNTNKGEIWYCEVTPYDGADFGPTGTSTYSLIINTRPYVTNVQLGPGEPNSKQDLEVNYTYQDDDGDGESGTIFRWYLKEGNDFILKEITNEPILNYTKTRRNEVWEVRLEPRDGEGFGPITASNIVTIGNTPPIIQNVTIIPFNPTSVTNLSVTYDFFDIDDDLEGVTKFLWFYKVDAGSVNFTTTNQTNKSVPIVYLTKGQQWKCAVIPHDGVIEGAIVYSNVVVIDNAPPIIFDMKISPKAPQTTDEIEVSYNYTDPDFDPERETSFEWLKWSDTGNAFLRTGLKTESLSPVFTHRGEIWLCEVTPKDGNKFGTPLRSDSVQIGNSRPKAESLTINPGNPQTRDNLYGSYNFYDANNDPENGSTIYWYKNGLRIKELDNNLIVDSSLTAKGNSWYFSVIPKDGYMTGTKINSNRITIDNSPPEVIAPKITNPFPRGDEELNITFEYYDPDDDENQKTNIRWHKLQGNKYILQKDYNDMEILPSEATEKDDSWYFEIWVSDGTYTSKVNQSFPFNILNSAPVINKSTPNVSEVTINENEFYEFSIEVMDMDSDPLQYSWIRTPDTAIISETNISIFNTDFDSAGEYTINVSVWDYSYTIYHEWTVIVLNVNRPPFFSKTTPRTSEINLKTKQSQIFSVVPLDHDINDDLTVTWYFDGTEAAVDANAYTYLPGGYSMGDHVVTASVNDGSDSFNRTWNVTVKGTELTSDYYYGLTWDQWSVFIQVIVITATAIIGIIAFYRLRRKRGVLQDYMDQIEKPMKLREEDPIKSEIDLVNVAETIEGNFNAGMIEDMHYFLLDRQLKENLRDLRQERLEKYYSYLPADLTNEIGKIIEDGKITDNEYKSFRDILKHYEGLTSKQKKAIRTQMKTWRDLDRGIMDKKKSKRKFKLRRKDKD
jgi:parallel beta-helix repeat protein